MKMITGYYELSRKMGSLIVGEKLLECIGFTVKTVLISHVRLLKNND